MILRKFLEIRTETDVGMWATPRLNAEVKGASRTLLILKVGFHFSLQRRLKKALQEGGKRPSFLYSDLPERKLIKNLL